MADTRAGNRLFYPTERGKRDPLSNEQQNGTVTNPPRYAQLGGLKSARRGVSRNMMTIKKPGK